MQNGKKLSHAFGFTLIELIIALTIVSLILTIAAPKYFGNITKTKEAVLREDLYVLRDAIDKFYSDKNKYPATLEELIKEKYLRAVPVDPFTQSSHSWIIVSAEDASMGVVSNIKSSAPNLALDGTWYKDW